LTRQEEPGPVHAAIQGVLAPMQSMFADERLWLVFLFIPPMQ
jgi:hypothetical protein